ncbi:hypothetical protein [Nocardioides sp. GY 10127]|uniref:hypothetical protein n=1 Tax=Nocardioides sp. GY 10127 TaxID=2569762 RepID=UPI0014587B72|nr:hypothetical protein [Nocardioides sp. GY 10127]
MTTLIAPLARRAAAVLAVLGVAGTSAVLLAGPASAEVPTGWSDPAPVDPLHAFLVILIIPAAIALVIAALVLGPALARGERVLPGAASGDHEWIGGPEVEPAKLGAGKADDEAGGTSAHW